MSALRRASLPGLPQPLIAVTLTLMAAIVLAWSFWHDAALAPSLWQVCVASVLVFLVVAAYRFPIHIDTHTKVEIVTVPVFVLALLGLPALAAAAAGIAIFWAESLVRARRGLYWSDIWTAASRWVLLVLVAATLSERLQTIGVPLPIVLIVGACWLFLGDVCTLPLVLVAMNQRRPLRMIPALAREMWRVEAAQYLLGVIAVLMIHTMPWALPLLIYPVYLVYASFRRAYELQGNTRTLLQQMADMVDRRDPLTEQHSLHVAELCVPLLRELQVGAVESDLIVAAARVHDLGKIGISEAILHKPALLTAEEWTVMRSHVELGATMLEQSLQSGRQGQRLAWIIRGHHERWDGAGYPHGLAGADIPLGGRVIAVADAFDAMTSDRSYRARMSEQLALAVLRQGRGTQWDPAVVDAFLRTRVQPSPLPADTEAPTVLSQSYRS
jgi:hypothetical protein